MKNNESKNDEQIKPIKDSREKIKTSSQYRIKPPLLKSIFGQDVEDERIANDNAKKKKIQNSRRYGA